ncbi:MAG: GNAT family N-acetyltransferase [Anaeroplasma sp.]
MEERIVDKDIVLVPYFKNEDVAIKWYLDSEVCKQVDNIDFVYDLERLNQMYNYLSNNGYCYYIKYQNVFVGDITLRFNTEVCLVICKEYQNKHIGRRCVLNILQLAKENGYKEVKANIYSFNFQSQNMFKAIGFEKISDEWYLYRLD